MKTIASMREYINEYIRSQSIETTGRRLLNEQFNIPFQCLEGRYGDEYWINGAPMSHEEAKDYIKEFFEALDTASIMELYNKIKV
jgi:hypothetical protein